MLSHKSWVYKFRPDSLDKCFLPKVTRESLQADLESGTIPDYFFSGGPGIGKTTAALAVMQQLGAEYILINGSLQGSIDTLRTTIQQFASTVSLTGDKKYIILDEADRLSAAFQEALRGFIDEFAANCGFILTANYRNKVIAPLISRLTEVSFIFDATEKPILAKGLYLFLVERFNENDVVFDNKAVQTFIVDHLKRSTDIRKLIMQAQSIAKTGVFNAESLNDGLSERFDVMVSALKSKNFNQMRQWVGENSDIEPERIFRFIYDHTIEITKPTLIPQLIMIINEAQYKHAFVADSELNIVACLTEIMAEVVV